MKKLFLLFVISWFGLLNGSQKGAPAGSIHSVNARICGDCLGKWKNILSTDETLCRGCASLNCKNDRDPRSKIVTIGVKKIVTPKGSCTEERSLMASPNTLATVVTAADRAGLRPPSLSDDDLDSDHDYHSHQSLASSSSSSSSPTRHSPHLGKRKSSSSPSGSSSSPSSKKKRKNSK